MNFATELHHRSASLNSVICAGFDPTLEQIPQLFRSSASSGPEQLYKTLRDFVLAGLEAVSDLVATIKPNIAFFEQYGVPGIRALVDLTHEAAQRHVPIILDAKRGDIASTAEAYCKAYLESDPRSGYVYADALTMNPFLGFDTVDTFLKACEAHGKGLFVLVRTSNPGASDIQGLSITADSLRVMDRIADQLARSAHRLVGEGGFSGVGAVVGATAPQEARALRARMPDNLFLIPGFGAQGAAATDAVAGFCPRRRGGGIVNVSRGIFGVPNLNISSREEYISQLRARVNDLQRQLTLALQG